MKQEKKTGKEMQNCAQFKKLFLKPKSTGFSGGFFVFFFVLQTEKLCELPETKQIENAQCICAAKMPKSSRYFDVCMFRKCSAERPHIQV